MICYHSICSQIDWSQSNPSDGVSNADGITLFFGRKARMSSEAVESSQGPCKLDHGGLEPNAIAIYEEVMYRMLPLIHSSHPPHL